MRNTNNFSLAGVCNKALKYLKLPRHIDKTLLSVKHALVFQASSFYHGYKSWDAVCYIFTHCKTVENAGHLLIKYIFIVYYG